MQKNIVEIIQKNPNAWNEYLTRKKETGFIEDLKIMEDILLNEEDVEKRTALTCSVAKFVFYNVFSKLSLKWDENMSLADMYKTIENTGVACFYGAYTCFDSMDNRISNSSYETKNFTRRILITLYYIVNNVFHSNLGLGTPYYLL